ncbi:MAG TPA: beta-ketoacyl-ACP synthase II [Candidatus Acidoferrales bacterium]|nr:beta-ketoacyl-ACP synthase II [Candidatus Acidoferrales bacterium]
MKSGKRVVVTGLGAITPIGLTVDEFWRSMMDGKSGAGSITYFDTSKYDTKFACEVKGFDPLKYFDRKTAQRMDLFTQFAMAAAAQALEQAQIDFEKIDRDRVGVVVGSGIGGMWTYQRQQETLFNDRGPQHISPFFIPMMISDIAAGNISIRYKLKGPNYATTSACATSGHAIADAAMLIQRGDADLMITGGAEAAICPMGIGGFNSMKALSTNNEDCVHASRPFDAKRDGFVMGEGGGILVIESYESAVKRGVKILAELAGFGLTADAYHLTQPAPGGEGAVRAMRLCLKDAGLDPQDIDYINAHGTSTPPGDKGETQAIKTVFGEHAKQLLVSSTKSMTGHLLGAAGAVEAIATILAIANDTAPPTINYEFPDPDCNLDYVPNKPIKRTIKAAMSNVFGFGGHNNCLLFTKFREQ